MMMSKIADEQKYYQRKKNEIINAQVKEKSCDK